MTIAIPTNHVTARTKPTWILNDVDDVRNHAVAAAGAGCADADGGTAADLVTGRDDERQAVIIAALHAATANPRALLHDADLDAICVDVGVDWRSAEARFDLTEAIQVALARKGGIKNIVWFYKKTQKATEGINLLLRYDYSKKSNNIYMLYK